MKKRGFILVLAISLFIFLYGIITISNNLPKLIKDNSSFKINYTFVPFDFRVEFSEYSLYLNSKVLTNIKNGSVHLVNSIGGKLQDGASNFFNKTSNVFENIEDKFEEVIEDKIK